MTIILKKLIQYLRKEDLAKASKKTSRKLMKEILGIYNNENINVV